VFECPARHGLPLVGQTVAIWLVGAASVSSHSGPAKVGPAVCPRVTSGCFGERRGGVLPCRLTVPAPSELLDPPVAVPAGLLASWPGLAQVARKSCLSTTHE
jgi:hypothetical protein